MWPNKKISKLLFVCSETSKSNGVKLENSYRNSDTSPYVECLSLLKKGIQEVNYRLCWIVNVLLTKLRKQKIMISGEWIGRIWRMLFKNVFCFSLSLYMSRNIWLAAMDWSPLLCYLQLNQKNWRKHSIKIIRSIESIRLNIEIYTLAWKRLYSIENRMCFIKSRKWLQIENKSYF